MRYYDSKGRIREFKEERLKYLNHGQTANVYHIDPKTLLKRYFSYVPDTVIIDEAIFKILTSKKSQHIVPLYQILKDDSLEKTIGYLMQYVNEYHIDYLTSESDLFLSHIRDIELIVDELSKENIRVMDLKSTNVITTKNGLVIIDPDKYRVVDYDPTFNNKDQVLYLAYSLLNYGKSEMSDSLDRIELLKFRRSIDLESEVDITSQLARTLTKVKAPIDIFKRAI